MARKTTPNRIKTSLIPDIKKAIRALAKTPPEEISLKAAVRQAMPDIHEARAAGRSFDDIAVAFTGFGVKISGSTLNSYVRDEMRSNAGKSAAKETRESSDKVPASSAQNIEKVPSASEPAIKLVFENIVDDPEEETETGAAPAPAGFPTKTLAPPYEMEDELRALNDRVTDDIAADD